MDEYDNPKGTIYIEIRGIYDGWSVAQLPDGKMVNRWPKGSVRYNATQRWIEREESNHD